MLLVYLEMYCLCLRTILYRTKCGDKQEQNIVLLNNYFRWCLVPCIAQPVTVWPVQSTGGVS